MNAPFFPPREIPSFADLGDPGECARIEAFVAAHPDATPFHRPAWLQAVAESTGNRALALLSERDGEIAAFLPLTEVHSPVFGRLLASSGFAVGGGVLAGEGCDSSEPFASAVELAQRR